MMTPARHELRLPSGETLVFDWLAPASGPQVAVFVHGLGSHRRGDKALHFAERFVGLGWGFLAVDLRGHGESGGALRQLTLTNCLEDLAAVLRWIPKPAQPRLLIGSSMGGAVVAWHQALHPQPGCHVALIAPSLYFPDRFTRLPPAEMAEWKRTGTRRFLSSWIDLQIGYDLVTDAAQYPHERLVQSYAAPTLILHGLQDVAVPWKDSVEFLEESPAPGIDLVLIKQGDHRLTDHKGFLFDTMASWLKQSGVL